MLSSLLIGSRSDPHVDAVLARLNRQSIHAEVIDASTMASALDYWRPGEFRLGQPAGSSRSQAGTSRGWIRRLADEDAADGLTVGSLKAAELQAKFALLHGLMLNERTTWLTAPSDLAAAENKIAQLEAGWRLGLPIPRTVVSADPDQRARLLGDSYVVKPLGPSMWVDDGVKRVVHTTRLEAASPQAQALNEVPFLAQEPLEAIAHWRVVTVGTLLWASRLDARGLPLDWRAAERSHSLWSEGELPAGVDAQAHSIAEHFRLGYSSQDWLQTERHLFFLELNPAGQWLFLPNRVRREITAAIAEWLAYA